MSIGTLLSGSLLALVLAVAGCGGGDAADPLEPPGAPPDEQAPAAPTSLELTIWPAGEGEGESIAYTLTCDPPGGDHPNPEEACAVLAEVGAAAFAPVPGDAVCTQQYGGPMEAHVRGSIEGEPVDARFAYTDGCEIARWNALEAVVPRPQGELR